MPTNWVARSMAAGQETLCSEARPNVFIPEPAKLIYFWQVIILSFAQSKGPKIENDGRKVGTCYNLLFIVFSSWCKSEILLPEIFSTDSLRYKSQIVEYMQIL